MGKASENALFERNVQEQHERLQALAEASNEIVASAEARLASIEKLAAEDAVSQTAIEESAQALDSVGRSLFDVMRRRAEVETDEPRRRSQQAATIADARSQYLEAQRRAA